MDWHDFALQYVCRETILLALKGFLRLVSLNILIIVKGTQNIQTALCFRLLLFTFLANSSGGETSCSHLL